MSAFPACCSILSVMGIIFLLALGALFDAGALTHSTEDPDDPHAVARNCYTAAGVYGVVLVICLIMLTVQRRRERNNIRL
ncbi:uncharacterized protein VTP21DRAFT_10724 [Calcarisporiella thermophila]|uniref:uncharacterized protein n=1 Tax=Calcarisporiella thermophila TaxID=911321 RepID=UPI003743B869